MSNTVSNCVFALLAFGAIPAVFAGFAPATKVAALQAQNTTIQGTQRLQLVQLQQNQLDSKIIDTRIRQCRAMESRMKGNADAEHVVQFATGRLQEQLEEFRNLTKNPYRLPDCSEV